MENKKSYWLKSGLFTIAGRLSVIIFGLGSVVLLLRALSKGDFGTWALFLTITAFVEVGRMGLLRNALIKFLADSESDEDYARISTASMVLNAILTIFFIILLCLLALPLSNFLQAPELQPMLYVYAITTTLLIPFTQFNSVQQANFDFVGTFWSNFARQGLFFIYILGSFVSGAEITIVGLAIFQVITAAVGAIVSWWFTRPYIKMSRTIDWSWISKLFHFGKFVFGTNLSTMIYKSIDKLMLGSMLSPVAVGIYELAIKITNLAEVPTFSVASIVFPQSAKAIKTEGLSGIKTLYEKSVGAILAILLPFIGLVLLFPEWVITIIAGEKYLDAIPVLQLTMLYGLFIPFAVQFGTVLDSIGKPKINFYYTLLGASLNIIFNYLFISNFGLIGAAYGTLTTYLLTFTIMQWTLYRELKVRFYNVFQHIFPFYKEGFAIIQQYLKKQQSPEIVETNIITADPSSASITQETTN